MAIVLNKTSFLDAPIQVESMHGVTFSSENKGHTFVISAMRGGELVALTGTVTAKFMRSNNTTILLAGSGYTGIVDGKATVTLHQDCYNIPGRFQLAIFITENGETSCIYACVGMVQRTQNGDLIDSGEVVPSLEELLETIDDCEAATTAANAAAAAVPGLIADTFSTSVAYAAGDYVYHDGSLYKFTADHAAGAWTGTDAVVVKMADDLGDLKSAFEESICESVPWEIGTEGQAQRWDSGSSGTNSVTDNTKYTDISAYKYIRYMAFCSSANNTSYGIAFYTGKTVGSYVSGVQGYSGVSGGGMREQWAKVPDGAIYARFTVRKDFEGFFIEGYASIPDKINEIINDQDSISQSIVEILNEQTSISQSIDDANRVISILGQLGNNSEFTVSNVGTSVNPSGWRTGKWGDSGSVVADDTSICIVGRIGIPGGNQQRTGAKGIYVTSTFGTIEIKHYRDGAVIETINGENIAYCGGTDGDMLGVSITGLTSPSSDYIENDDITNIHIFVMFQAEVKGDNVGTEYFKVSINKTWIDGNADSLNAVDVDCVLKLPKNYSPGGKPVRLIFMHHGNSGTVNVENQTWYSEVSSWKNMVNTYINAGYAVFDVNGCGPVTDADASHDYGAFGALQAAFKAYEYITNKYNIRKRIFVHGSSMGGATAYAFVKAYGGIVDAVGLFSPALLSRSAEMSSIYDYIAVNYGYTDRAAMVADGYTHLFSAAPGIQYYQDGAKVEKEFTYDWVNNHVADGIDLYCADFKVPVKIWCGTADTAVDPEYGKALSEAIINAGGLAIFRSVDGAGHNAGIGSSSLVNSEAVLWFDRFN